MKQAPPITMLRVEVKDESDSVLTIDLSDDFVKWFKQENNLKRNREIDYQVRKLEIDLEKRQKILEETQEKWDDKHDVYEPPKIRSARAVAHPRRKRKSRKARRLRRKIN